MIYVDRLQHGLDICPFQLPRCSVFDSKIISEILAMDRRGDVPDGEMQYGNLNVSLLSFSQLFCFPSVATCD